MSSEGFPSFRKSQTLIEDISNSNVIGVPVAKRSVSLKLCLLFRKSFFLVISIYSITPFPIPISR